MSTHLKNARRIESRKTVLLQNVFIGILIWLACLGDLGWTVWTDLQIAPAFLDLTLVAAALFARPQAVVFWGGLSGLLTSVIHAEPLQLSVPLYCTVALVAAGTQPSEHQRPTLSSTALRSFLILSALTLGKIWLAEFPSIGFIQTLKIEQFSQVAFTFLISILFCMLFLYQKRRTVWM